LILSGITEIIECKVVDRSVSFENKMAEAVNNFCQLWPMYALLFELITEILPNADGTTNFEEVPQSVLNNNTEPLTDVVVAVIGNTPGLDATIAICCTMSSVSPATTTSSTNIANKNIHPGDDVDGCMKDKKAV
jgi:hypothetical protein